MMKEKMNEVLKAIEGNIETYNAENSEKVLETIKEGIEEYNALFVENLYITLLAEESPFLAALENPYYNVKKIVVKDDKEDKTKKVASLDVAEKIIDLMALEDYYLNKWKSGDGALEILSNNMQWKLQIDKLARTFSLRIAKELEASDAPVREKFKVTAEGNLIQLPTGTSNTQTIKQVQFILDGIIFKEGEKKDENAYKVIKKDIVYLEKLLCREGKAGAVKVPRTSTMLRLITKMAHRIITDGTYEVE